MSVKFDVRKCILKGIEGAIVAGGGTGLAVVPVDSEEFSKATATVFAAVLGFVFRAARNWLKHMKKERQQ